MKKISIVIVGNCQARPLAMAISELVPEIEISGIAIVHLVNDESSSKFSNLFINADYIFAQRVTDTYRCNFVRTNKIISEYGGRVRVWPNLYYAGYNPEIFYLKGRDGNILMGPLGHYHNKTIYEAWSNGKKVSEAVSDHSNILLNLEKYRKVPEQSLSEFRRREDAVDIKIVDWMEDNLWTQRLFFAFNHPSQLLLEEVAFRLLLSIGLNPNTFNRNKKWVNEPLGRYRYPLNPWVAESFKITFDDFEGYSGIEINSNDRYVAPLKYKSYDIGQLAQQFFMLYDAEFIRSSDENSIT